MELTIEQMKDELIKYNGSSPEHSHYNFGKSSKTHDILIGSYCGVQDIINTCQIHRVSPEDAWMEVRLEQVPFVDYQEENFYLCWYANYTNQEWEEWIRAEYQDLLRKKQTQHERDMMQYNILKEKLGL